MRAASLLGLVAIMSQPGCAARAPGETAKTNQRLEELAQQEAALRKQIEEIQNRLFLLEDKVDTSRVAIERSKPPQLPVVRLRPQASSDDADDAGADGRGARESEQGDDGSETGEQPLGGRSVVARRSVIYEGDAGREGPRPVLKLHEAGASAAGQTSSPVTFSGPDPAGVNEKLPVVPLPKRPALQKQVDLRPMQEYQNALAKYRAGDFVAAAEAFRKFFQRYSQHAYADNALYWLAECSYDLKKYQAALKFFRQVVEHYPSGNKAPDALLKMAYCYVQLKDKKNARAILGQVMESYPRSQVAKLASAAMAKL